MKHVVLAALAAAFAVAAPARADTVLVHLDASSKVVLERVDDHGDTALACRAPCDVALETGARYRIDGDGIRPSAPFLLEGRDGSRVVLTPSLASTRAFTAGVVLTSLATRFLGGALAGLGGAVAANDDWGGLGAGLLGILSGAVSLSLGIPGAVMLANNVHSTVSFASDARSAIRPPSFASIPILSGSF